MESTAPELLYSGSFGGGKTLTGCRKALFLAQRYPGTTVGVFRKRLKHVKQTTMETFRKEVCPPEHIVKESKADLSYTVRAGRDGRGTSVIQFMGLTNEAGESLNIRSLNLASAFVDEAIELLETEWDEIGGRLRDPNAGVHQLFGATNPANQGHWLYQRFFRAPEPGVHEVVETNTLENPYLPESYVQRLRRYKGRYYDRYVLGKWVDFEGLVYDVFDPLVHQITWEQFAERFGTPHIPAGWRRVCGIDFGYSNPFVCQWWAQSPDGDWFRYREIYHSRRLVADHAKQIRALEQATGERIAVRYADHDAEDRATLDAAGLPTVPAVKEVSPGIQTTYELLKPEAETGRPRIYFLRDVLVEEDPYLANEGLPTCTEDEIQAYRYPKGTNAKNPKEEPVKRDDHGMDTLRYVMHSERTLGAGIVAGTRQPSRPPVRVPRGEMP